MARAILIDPFRQAITDMEEALILRAGHAFQLSSDWHKRRPPLD
jgi:hypothetical protein